ncbi:PilZ domain-containing protein [Desulfospira joergensenii]|uniref:PilZ domain-containing protein n=1 Tax=Desulfospira joergensenii TaxID=53329 RepID=UPI0003B61307|nr:PilZ domain-containing protein [Desulfospira joergensenii]
MENSSEKRQYERHASRTVLDLYRHDNQDLAFPARLNNYSRGGMCLETSEEMDVGQHVYIKIRNYDPRSGGFEKYDKYTGYVRWSDELGTSYPGGQYGYGIEYSEAVTY